MSLCVCECVFPDANSFITCFLNGCLFETVCAFICDTGHLAWLSSYAICQYSALTLGRRQSSRSSWCRGRPPSYQTWGGSGGWLQRSHSGKPGPQRARCQCSGRTQSHFLVGCHTCEKNTEYLNITLSQIIDRMLYSTCSQTYLGKCVCWLEHTQFGRYPIRPFVNLKKNS